MGRCGVRRHNVGTPTEVLFAEDPARGVPRPFPAAAVDNFPRSHAFDTWPAPLCFWGWGVHMKSKPLTNERTHPYFVDIPVAALGLDVALSRQIMNFHKSRQLQLRHGRTNSRGGEHYYR